MKVLRWLEGVSGVLASLAGGVAIVYLLNIPFYAAEFCHSDNPDEPARCTRSTASLLQVNGATAVVDLSLVAFLVLGVGIAAVVHSLTGRRGARTALWVATGAFAVYTVLALFTIGGPFLPSVALALVASAFSLGHRPAAAA